MVKIAIIGGRDYFNYSEMESVVLEYFKAKGQHIVEEVSHIVSGGAKGADKGGELLAEKYGIEKIIHLPDWEKYQRAAGMVRNKKIIEDADIVFAFWDGKSKGTQNGIELTRKNNKELILTIFKKESALDIVKRVGILKRNSENE